MDNSRQPPRVDVVKSESGDLVRQSSLLPGEVRTPTMIVTLSEAWGDVSGDWAAPGSSVWEEEVPSRHSAQTPLTGYGREGDVWASATGIPLLGNDDGADEVSAFATAAAAQRAAPHESPMSEAAELAAAALQAFVPHADPQGLRHGMPPPASTVPAPPPPQRGGSFHQQLQPLHQPRYASDVRYSYDGRFGTVHAAPISDPVRGMQGAVPLHRAMHPTPPAAQQQQQQQQQLPAQGNYFTVQEGGDVGRGGRGLYNMSAPTAAGRGTMANYNIPVLANGVSHTVGGGSGGGLFGGTSNGGVSLVPRLDDEEVAQSIIASAGLPLSLHSLVEYIHGGQPQTPSHVSALGTTQNALRNYPNLNEPPSEEDAFHSNNSYNGVGANMARSGWVSQPSYMAPPQQQQQQQPGRWSQPSPAAVPDDNNGFAVRGSDYGGSSQLHPSPPPTFQNDSEVASGGFVVSAGNGPINPRVSPQAAFGTAMVGHGGVGATGRHKSESEYLSDLLHFHANFFPPPPPPRVPKEERRNRAELWYHYASKWDITHRLPPPPRTPLPEMELEYRMRLQRMTRVPYHGDGWLQMGERWFDVTQMLFDFPDENVGEEVDFNVVLQQAVLA